MTSALESKPYIVFFALEKYSHAANLHRECKFSQVEAEENNCLELVSNNSWKKCSSVKERWREYLDDAEYL